MPACHGNGDDETGKSRRERSITNIRLAPVHSATACNRHAQEYPMQPSRLLLFDEVTNSFHDHEESG